MMPVMDGWEMIRKIKENNNICHIPLYYRQKASLDDRIAGLEQGIDDYINKTFQRHISSENTYSFFSNANHTEIYMETDGRKRNKSCQNSVSSQPQIPYDEQFMQQWSS